MSNEIDKKVNQKIYKLKNIDKIIEYNRQYKLDNYEKINEPFICECGSIYTFNHRTRHFKTRKHQKFISQQLAVSELELASQSESKIHC